MPTAAFARMRRPSRRSNAHLIPETGGDTIFSNTAWVYEQIDPLFAAYLESLTVIQSADATGHITDRYLDPQEAIAARQRMPPFEMPLVRVHPVSAASGSR